MPIAIAITLLASLFVVWVVSNSRAATESPAYEVISKDADFELREYPPLLIASTPMSEEKRDGSFGELFRFITGRNEAQEKISMTAPVLINTAGGHRTMSFVMPKKTVEKGVPKPTARNVTLHLVQAGRFVSMRFAGSGTEKNEKAAVASVKRWMEAQKIQATGDPIFAYYDPPWTPIGLRRNEVLIPIGEKPSSE